MNRHIVLLILSLFSGCAFAVDWIKIADSDTHLWEGRAATREFSKTRGGKDIVAAAGRTFDKRTRVYAFEKWYVSVEDCYQGHGKMVTTDMDGNYKYENEFVEKGGTGASSIASMLCFAALERKQEIESKSL